jgi:hypothetical protein
MPRIDDRLLSTVVYLYESRSAAKKGVAAGGSGFLVNMPYDQNPELRQTYVVTNKHVLDGGFHAVRVNTEPTEPDRIDVIETDPGAWTSVKEDDIAVIAVSLPEAVRWSSFGPAEFITPEILVEQQLGPGDEIVLLGRLVTHAGIQKNNPAVRFGNLSIMADEPVQLDTGSQEAFVVECRSIAGLSGSAVLVYPALAGPGPVLRMRMVGTPEFHLLGIDCAHIPLWRPVYEEDKRTKTTFRVEANTGMSAVIPAWRILNLLNQRHLVKQREEEDTEITKRRGSEPTAIPDRDDDDVKASFTKEDFEDGQGESRIQG